MTGQQNTPTAARSRYAIIVAGGKGLRMGSPLPKQFLLLDKKPVLYHAIRAFTMAFPDMHITLVHAAGDEPLIAQVTGYFPERSLTLIPGGATRFQSVKNGLETVGESSIVFIHDGVRPLVSPELIQRCEKVALEKGNAIPSVELRESIRSVRGAESFSEDRTRFRAVQTPQTFRSEIIREAFGQPFDPGFTDEASVLEKMGAPIHLIEGEYRNLKITQPEDLVLAEILLADAAGNV